jgi:hypothetical protein
VRIPSAEEVSRVEVLLKSALLQPHLRVVVTKDGRPLGRLAARLKARCIRIWNPDFRDGVGADEIQEAMRLMINCVTAIRSEAGLAHLAIENRPGDDLKHNDIWPRALRQQGYVEICAYRVYALSLDWVQKPGSKPQGLTIDEVGRVGENALVGLYRSVKSRTLEQRHVGCDRPAEAIEHMKKIGRGNTGAIWLLAGFDGVPAGYALVNLADEAGFDGVSAWLVDIGCVPETRRN